MVEYLAGRNAVVEALRAGRRAFERVYLAEGVAEQELVAEILRCCRERGIAVARVRRAELDRLSDDMTHQGVIAQTSAYPYAELDQILSAVRVAKEPALILALDSLQDPQNVGALLRTADAVGVHGVVIAERRAAQITPAVSRASAGAVEHLLVARVTNLVRTLAALKQEGLWVAGLEGRPEAQDYRRANLALPLALVLGSEGAGLRRLVAQECDFLVRIPMRGRVSSLNVSVAGALALYQIWHAREPAA